MESNNTRATSQWIEKWSPKHSPNENSTSAIAEHHAEVDKVAASVRAFHERGEKFRIFHGSTNSTRKSAMGKDRSKTVDTSRLNRVLYVNTDPDDLYALVQPNVPMDRLVEATLEYGLVPPVVMEFPGITVGGGYAGTSGESSSFKHGYFNQTLEQVEMVLANGDVVTCSEHERRDLFRGAAGAVGTLGVTTLVKLRLHKATKYVETTYHPVQGGMTEAMQIIQKFTTPDSEYDYVDGIMFSKTHGAIVTGRMTDTPAADLPIQRFSDAKDPWFYLHAQDRVTKNNGPTTEAVPLPEYLFRYDRGGFWVGAAAFDYFPGVPFNDFTRWWLDDFLHTRMLYTAMHASGRSEHMIVQDLALPYATAKEFVDFTDERYGIYPLWLCPLNQSPQPTMHPHSNEVESDGKTQKQLLNIGLWGPAPPTHEAFMQANRDLEQKLLELDGMKWLYAQTYYTEDEFWSQFDKAWYDALREKYNASGLPSVYEKVKVDHTKDAAPKSLKQSLIETWPFSGLYGLRKAIASGDYVQSRDSAWKKWVPRS
jgi:delta24-sterol reductase